jgi:hypothetical protein
VLYQNPWWSTGSVPGELVPEKTRFVFKELRDSLQRPGIELLLGPRNTGKTTLIYHLIDHLLKRGVDPRRILYCSFEDRSLRFPRVLDDYQHGILQKRLTDTPAYFFLDEIHYLEGWEPKLMYLRDAYPKLKIVATSSVALDRMMSESRRARFRIHRLPPLSFLEFLHLRGEAVPRVEGAVRYRDFEAMLRLNLSFYTKRGFPEIVSAGDRFARRYIREFLLTRIVFRDIWEVFEAKDMGLVRDIAELLISNPGAPVNVNALASEFKRARLTIHNVLEYLELTYLVRPLPNLRGPKLRPSRKNTKFYPLHSSLTYALRDEEPDERKVIETLISCSVNALGYCMTGGSEIDFVLRANGRPFPIAISLSDRITDRNLRGLRNFCRRFGTPRGIMITRSATGRLRWAELVPAYLFLAYPLKAIESALGPYLR